MKLNLQYFAEPTSDGTAPTSGQGQQPSSSAGVQSGSASQPSSSAKTYTQAEVNRIASQAVGDYKTSGATLTSSAVASAVAHQKKLDNMNATELKQELQKEHQQKINKILAENKQYKHTAALNKALKATNKMLSDNKIPNSSELATLVADVDPKARAKKVQSITKWLKNYTDNVKTQLLKGKNEPQTSTGTAKIPTSGKDGKKLNPFTYALLQQKQQK